MGGAGLGFTTELPEACSEGGGNWCASDPGQVVDSSWVGYVRGCGCWLCWERSKLLATPTLRVPLKLPLQSLGLSNPPCRCLRLPVLSRFPQILLG